MAQNPTYLIFAAVALVIGLLLVPVVSDQVTVGRESQHAWVFRTLDTTGGSAYYQRSAAAWTGGGEAPSFSAAGSRAAADWWSSRDGLTGQHPAADIPADNPGVIEAEHAAAAYADDAWVFTTLDSVGGARFYQRSSTAWSADGTAPTFTAAGSRTAAAWWSHPDGRTGDNPAADIPASGADIIASADAAARYTENSWVFTTLDSVGGARFYQRSSTAWSADGAAPVFSASGSRAAAGWWSDTNGRSGQHPAADVPAGQPGIIGTGSRAALYDGFASSNPLGATIMPFVTLGFVVAILAIAFALTGMGTGGFGGRVRALT